jgi:hypothetical protein
VEIMHKSGSLNYTNNYKVVHGSWQPQHIDRSIRKKVNVKEFPQLLDRNFVPMENVDINLLIFCESRHRYCATEVAMRARGQNSSSI